MEPEKTRLASALENKVWIDHTIGSNYQMDGKPGWKIVYYPIFEDGKNSIRT